MSSIQLLRAVVNERLSAAAEEIFEAVRKTIAGYEEEILLSKREIQRQRRMLQGAAKPEPTNGERRDQPQLDLCVWDEDFPSEQEQQGEELGREPRQAEKNQEEVVSSGGEENAEDGEEDNSITFIFTPPYVKNELEQLSCGYNDTKAEEDPLPSTSAEPSHEMAAIDDDDSSSCSADEHGDSGEEWRGSEGSQSDVSDRKWKRRKKSRLRMTPKLHPAKSEKTRISCKVCGKAFHAIVSLVNHMKGHSKDVCGVCGERFESEEDFQVHLKTHVKAEICGVCGKCFSAISALETHMRIHTGEKPFKCGACGKSFNCRHNMMRHIRIHTGEKPYPCTVCGKSFNDYSTRKRHLLLHVNKQNTDSLNAPAGENGDDVEEQLETATPKKQQSQTICDKCGKMFHSVVSLVNHAKSHASDLCGICGIHFESEENLKLHLKTHKSGKVCDVCGKCFDCQRSLEIHMRVHTGEKPFLCTECGKSFNCRHNMLRHTRTHTGEKPYTCNVCGRRFSDHSSLKQHSGTHTGEKPHRCEVCGKGFYRKAYVRLHMKSHAQNR